MKEGDSTEKLVESLVEELNCETVFTIPVFGGRCCCNLDHYGGSYYSKYSIRKESKRRETGKGTAYAGISNWLGTGFL